MGLGLPAVNIHLLILSEVTVRVLLRCPWKWNPTRITAALELWQSGRDESSATEKNVSFVAGLVLGLFTPNYK